MRRVRSKDTGPELALRRAAWASGLRGWRCHPAGVPGRPDLAWPGLRIAVFVDGAFWHGHPDYYWGQSGPFWDAKIDRNRARDREVDAELHARGWRVVRLWDFEISDDPDRCVRVIADEVAVARSRA